MTDIPGRDREPDPAALDELSRAFSIDGSDSVEGVRLVPLPPADDHPAPDLADDDLDPTAPTPTEWVPDAAVDDLDEPYFGDPDDDLLVIDETDDDARDDTHDETGAETSADGTLGGVVPSVISIDDEELPDAVYVSGSLDGGRSGTIVVIEDDDTGDALKPESERDLRRGIEPRLRERRIAVRRAQGRKRLVWVGLGVVLVIIVVGALAVLGSGLFAVRSENVVVTGAVYTDQVRLGEIVDDLVGTPSLLVDTQAIERELEEIPWVESARVQVSFPRSATIEIRERAPMTTYQGPDTRFRVLDREGRVLDVLEMYPLAYVLLTGPDPVDLEVGQFAPRGYAAASELTKNLTGSIRGQVQRIDVTADGTNLSLWLNDGTEIRFGEARDLFKKLVRLETVLAEIAQEDAPDTGVPLTIDVSTDETTR